MNKPGWKPQVNRRPKPRVAAYRIPYSKRPHNFNPDINAPILKKEKQDENHKV